MRLGVLVALVTVALALPGFAPAQLPELPGLPEVPELPVPDVPETPTVPTVPGTTTPPPSPPPAPAPLPLTGGNGGSAEPTSTSSGSTGSRSTSSSSRKASSSGNSGPRTRFDRLPRRYEVLLERILRGEDVRASLRRLERALAQASPELRARILRLVRREIARLESGRVTPAERRRAERLRRVEELLAPRSQSGSGSATPAAVAVTAGQDAPAVPAASSPQASGDGGVGIASTEDGSAPKDEGSGVGARDSQGGLPGLPSLPDEISFGTFVLVLILLLLALAALAFGLAAVPSRALPDGRVRHRVRTSRGNLAFLGVVALGMMMLVLLVGAVA